MGAGLSAHRGRARVKARSEQPNEGRRAESGAGVEGHRGSVPGPEPPCEHAGNQRRQAAREVEQTKCRSTESRGRSIGHHRRQQPLSQPHVEAPEDNADEDPEWAPGQGQHDISGDEHETAGGENEAPVHPV